MRDHNFNRHFDLDSMLFEDMEWLSEQVRKPKEEFVKIATDLELDQDNWNRFWKRVRNYRTDVRNIQCIINGKPKMVTEEELEVLKQILCVPDIISNCCGANIKDGRCWDCNSLCEKVYVF